MQGVVIIVDAHAQPSEVIMINAILIFICSHNGAHSHAMLLYVISIYLFTHNQSGHEL